MALKYVLFVSLLVVAVATPIAQAQLSIGGLINITGTVFCTVNGSIGANGSGTPVFPNATVQLQCGNGTVVSTGITNGQGRFNIILGLQQIVLSTLLSNCNIVVITPLARCNATLPSSGILRAPLQFVGNSLIGGIFNVFNYVSRAFQFISS